MDLRPPVRLDLWALLLAAGIVAGTVAPPLAVALFLASLVVSGGAAIRRNLGRQLSSLHFMTDIGVGSPPSVAQADRVSPS
jgi:hypothetical protein